MRIAFVIPPIIEKVWTFSADQLYLGAARIAAGLLARRHDVSVLDCAVQFRTRTALEQRLRELRPDVAAVPVIFGTLQNAYRIAHCVKQCSDARVVFGGLPATFSFERVLRESPDVDVCVRGEGERTMLELADDAPLHDIAGLAYRSGETISTTPDRTLLEDLDSLPFPALQLFPMHRYLVPSMQGFVKVPSTNVETKRGCAYSCEFCTQSSKEGVRYRLRSIDGVVEELERIRTDHPFIRRVMIVDNDFLAPFAHGVGILEGLLSRGLEKQFEFMIATRVQNFLRDRQALISLCDRANVRLVYFGVEAVNEKNLARLKKIKEDYDLAALFAQMRERDVHSVGSYIIGFENESEADMLETVNASVRDMPSIVKYNILTPYPGTRIWRQYLDQGLLLEDRPLTDYDNTHQVVRHPVDGEKVFLKAYRRFHLSRRYLASIEWPRPFGRRKPLRLASLLHHILRRELFGSLRDLYRYVRYTLMGSQELIG